MNAAAAALLMATLLIQPRTTAQIEALNGREPEMLYSGRKFAGKSWVVIMKALI